MTATALPLPAAEASTRRSPTLADLVARLGNVPLERILTVPPPGTATEKHLIAAAEAADKCLCELVEGVLVEKAMGNYESRLALLLGFYLEMFLTDHNLGAAFGSDTSFRVPGGRIRTPDVSFYRWKQLAPNFSPEDRIFDTAADIAVEVISLSNTRQEMATKLTDYFAAGTQRVWYVYPKERRVRVFSAVDKSRDLSEDDSLTDAELLPGFSLSIRAWFARAEGQRQ